MVWKDLLSKGPSARAERVSLGRPAMRAGGRVIQGLRRARSTGLPRNPMAAAVVIHKLETELPPRLVQSERIRLPNPRKPDP